MPLQNFSFFSSCFKLPIFFLIIIKKSNSTLDKRKKDDFFVEIVYWQLLSFQFHILDHHHAYKVKIGS